jgi:hypothetical protein
MAGDGTCKIRLVRPSRLADRIRSYNILVNGKSAGFIGNNGTLEIAAPAGAITIQAAIDWARSAPLTVNALPDQTIEIEVSNPWSSWKALWAVTFGRNTYLLLTPRTAAAASSA